MKTLLCITLLLTVAFLALTGTGLCERTLSNYELEQELKAPKAQIESKAPERVETQKKDIHEGSDIGVKGLNDRVTRIEERIGEVQRKRWSDRVTLSGVIEVEAGYEDLDFGDPAEDDEMSSDITLATVELAVDVDIIKHVKGHVLFLWEEDDTEPVDLDEGIIIIDGEDVVPLYLNVGKLYVPFGYYESHFISDPLTLELGETRESAVKVGFANDMFEISAAIFNGDINETDEDDDHIDNWVASGIFTFPEDAVNGLGLVVGASYISNIADSDGLEDALDEEFGTDEIEDYIGGLSAFLSASFRERFFFEAEYVGAMDEFENDDLGLDPGEKFKPSAWNFELAYAITEKMEIAAKYEGSSDVLNLLPETQYGAVISYGLFENTLLSLECLHGEFENDNERNLITAQFALEF